MGLDIFTKRKILTRPLRVPIRERSACSRMSELDEFHHERGLPQTGAGEERLEWSLEVVRGQGDTELMVPIKSVLTPLPGEPDVAYRPLLTIAFTIRNSSIGTTHGTRAGFYVGGRGNCFGVRQAQYYQHGRAVPLAVSEECRLR